MIWRALAWLVTRPRVRDRLVRRAQRTPYSHIASPDGQSIYMKRWWLFNPYPSSDEANLRRFPWLPVSIRVHRILRPDQDRHLHDHPWNARTIILDGWYVEEREGARPAKRNVGYTGRLDHGSYHRIDQVSPGGALTLFFTFRYRGTWGFKVDGKKVPWREYLGV